jgi:hypothetical protein
MAQTQSTFKQVKYLPSRKNIDTNTYHIHYSTKEILDDFQTQILHAQYFFKHREIKRPNLLKELNPK